MINSFAENLQNADGKMEKHVPVIDCPDEVKSDQLFTIRVSLGKDGIHPNTTEHHIRWIAIYFHPDGEKIPYEVGRFTFSAHGESPQGPNMGPVFTHHEALTTLRVGKPGIIYAISWCNIHGGWQSSRKIKVSQTASVAA